MNLKNNQDGKISRLNISDLQRCDIAYDYYRRNYNFMYCTHADGTFKNIPLLEETMHYLSDRKIEIPDAYIDGFIHVYNKTLPVIKNEDDRQWLLRNIQPGPEIILKDFFELGCKTAKAFQTWEYIVNNLPDFEKYFTDEQITKYAEKWYALTHSILMLKGIEPQIDTSDKETVKAFGKNKYHFETSGEGFYKEFKNIDLNNLPVYICSLPNKDRTEWKNIVNEISGNNADVMQWLKKQPN